MRKIEKEHWSTCVICNDSLSKIKSEYGGSNCYLSKAMEKHILSHSVTLEHYFEDILKLKRPLCKCGICCKKCNISLRKNDISGFFWNDYQCGRNDGLKKWSEQAKVSRLGKNNPMFGKKPWNLNMNKGNSDYGKKQSLQKLGKKTSNEAKEKQSKSAKKRLIHGHKGHKHSEHSKRLMSIGTLNGIKNGRFKHTKTKPHIKMCDILKKNNVQFEEEKIVDCWVFDLYIKKSDIFIEVDGDYFHSNPKIYPNGPKTKTQKINFYRDSKKNQFCIDNKMKLLRFWESDILNNIELIEKEIVCKLNQ